MEKEFLEYLKTISKMNVEVISDLRTADSKCAALLDAKQSIGVDCEAMQLGPDGKLSIVQVVAHDSKILIFDVLKCPAILSGKLKTLLEDPNIIKIMHDCRADRINLAKEFGVSLQRVFDTQIAWKFTYPNQGSAIGYNDLCQRFWLPENALKDTFRHKFATQPNFWATRPLSRDMIQYAAGDVLNLPELYKALNGRIKGVDRAEFERMCS